MTMPKIGVQLYTVREHIQTYEDTECVFVFLKNLGVSVIQISGIGPIEPDKVAYLVDKYGMDVCVTHKSFDRMLNDLDALIDEHLLMHCDCIGIGSMPPENRKTAEGVREFIAQTNEIGRKMKKRGVQLAYHNHAFEFEKVGDKTIMDMLIEETDPEVFWFIPDVCWIQVGGEDPAAFLKKLTGRVKACHFRDGTIEGNSSVGTELGTGDVDIDACFKTCMELDIPYIVYEQENNYSENSLESTRMSYEHLKNLVDANS